MPRQQARALLRDGMNPTEIIATTSACALVAATVFNVGFFSQSNWSYISLLNVQDLALGTFAAIPAVGIAAGPLLMTAGQAVDGQIATTRGNLLILLAITIILLIVLAFWNDLPGRDYMVCIFSCMAAAGLCALLWIVPGVPTGVNVLVSVAAAVVVSFSLGWLSFEMAYYAPPDDLLRFRGGSEERVNILRISSQYVFFQTGDDISAINISNVDRLTSEAPNG